MEKFSSKTYLLREVPYNARDIQIIYGIWAKRYMSTAQIWYLYFRQTTTSMKACQVRLRKLKDYGLLRCIEVAYKRGESRPPNLWAIDTLGGELLIEERGVSPDQIDTTPWMHEDNNHKVLHLINTTNIQIALTHAVPTVGMTVSEWVDERELRSQSDLYSVTALDESGKEITRSFAPDAFFVLTRDEKQGKFWVEMDQATIDLEPSSYQKRSIIGKVRMMLAWEKSEQYKREFGTRPLRYLMVSIGNRRLKNMLAVAEKVFKEEVGYHEALTEEEKREKLALVNKLGEKIPFTTIHDITTHHILTSPIWQKVGSKEPQPLLE